MLLLIRRISTFEVVTYWSRDYVTIFLCGYLNSLMTFVLPIVIFIYQDLVYFHCLDIWLGYGYLKYLKTFDLLLWTFDVKKPILVDIWPGKHIYKKAYPIVFHIQTDIWISYAAFDISTFEVVTYWSRDYVTISFMWLFELTNVICITYCDIYLLRSSLFHCLDIWFVYGHMKYLKNICFIMWTFDLENLYVHLRLWPWKPIKRHILL